MAYPKKSGFSLGILKALLQDGCPLGQLATVSREWQAELERHNFAWIKLMLSRLVDFGSMTRRNRALVRYFWLCLELDEYDCTKCAPTRSTYADYDKWEEAFSIADTVNGPMQRSTDRAFEYLFESVQRFSPNFKRPVVFENFNQQYPVFMQRFLDGEDLSNCDSIRNPAPAVSRMAALASLKLEHLAASFIVDAGHFFKTDPSWEWPNLTSLAMTSKALAPDENPTEIGAVLQAAAAAAMKMPQLKTMEIWNGRKGLGEGGHAQ